MNKIPYFFQEIRTAKGTLFNKTLSDDYQEEFSQNSNIFIDESV